MSAYLHPWIDEEKTKIFNARRLFLKSRNIKLTDIECIGDGYKFDIEDLGRDMKGVFIDNSISQTKLYYLAAHSFFVGSLGLKLCNIEFSDGNLNFRVEGDANDFLEWMKVVAPEKINDGLF